MASNQSNGSASQHSIQHNLMQWCQRQMEREGDAARHPTPGQEDHTAGLYRVVRRAGRSRPTGLEGKLPGYLQRGTQLPCLQCYLSGPAILFLFLVGSLQLFAGIIVLTSGNSTSSIFLLLFGFLSILLYVFLCRKARKEYEALPPDHPDRHYYTNTSDTIAVYTNSQTQQIPAAAAMVNYRVGRNMYRRHLAAPVNFGGTVMPVVLPDNGSVPLDGIECGQPSQGSEQGQGGHSSTQCAIPHTQDLQTSKPYNPDEDKPPAYEDLFK